MDDVRSAAHRSALPTALRWTLGAVLVGTAWFGITSVVGGERASAETGLGGLVGSVTETVGGVGDQALEAVESTVEGTLGAVTPPARVESAPAAPAEAVTPGQPAPVDVEATAPAPSPIHAADPAQPAPVDVEAEPASATAGLVASSTGGVTDVVDGTADALTGSVTELADEALQTVEGAAEALTTPLDEAIGSTPVVGAITGDALLGTTTTGLSDALGSTVDGAVDLVDRTADGATGAVRGIVDGVAHAVPALPIVDAVLPPVVDGELDPDVPPVVGVVPPGPAGSADGGGEAVPADGVDTADVAAARAATSGATASGGAVLDGATGLIRSSADASVDASPRGDDRDHHRPARELDAAPANATSGGAAGAPLAITDGQRFSHGPGSLQPLPERQALPGSPAGEHDVSPD